MSALKFRKNQPDPNETLREKQKVEALKQRLNERFLKDPESCRKAALILENWLRKKK